MWMQVLATYQSYREQWPDEFAEAIDGMKVILKYSYAKDFMNKLVRIMDKPPLVGTITFDDMYKETTLGRGVFYEDISLLLYNKQRYMVRERVISILCDVLGYPLDISNEIWNFCDALTVSLPGPSMGQYVIFKKDFEMGQYVICDGTFKTFPSGCVFHQNRARKHKQLTFFNLYHS